MRRNVIIVVGLVALSLLLPLLVGTGIFLVSQTTYPYWRVVGGGAMIAAPILFVIMATYPDLWSDD